DTVESHQDGAVVRVAAREIGPDEHHGDTAGDADEDEAVAEVPAVREEGPGESRHEERRDDPVDDEGDSDLDPEFLGAEQEVQGFVADFAEDGVHHYEEAGGDGAADADESASLEGGAHGGDEVAEDDPDGHGEDDPEDEESV
ncbi:hypothetical protein LTR48_009364, partial [Friedmanniomyces endolithicus]